MNVSGWRQAPPLLPAMIDPIVYANYMTAIAERIKFPLSAPTLALYYTTLSAKLTTEQFEQAAGIVFSDYDEFGFPPPKVFLDAIATTLPPIDSEKILRQISKLGTPNPHGWLYPRIDTVRDALGEKIAAAYAAAGASLCFAVDGVTQDIARRAFANELATAQKADQMTPLLLPAPAQKQLTGPIWELPIGDS